MCRWSPEGALAATKQINHAASTASQFCMEILHRSQLGRLPFPGELLSGSMVGNNSSKQVMYVLVLSMEK